MFFQPGPRVLCVGAHPDDIELGAGGFVHRLCRDHGADVSFLILTEGRVGLRGEFLYDPTTRRRQALAAAQTLGVARDRVEVLQFADCRLIECEHEVIRAIENRLFDADGRPVYDMILTHSGEDTHSDHRIVHESSLSAVRNFHGTVLLYQAPSTKPNGFRPTFFVELDDDDIKIKEEAVELHVSQQDRQYTQAHRIRGMAQNWALFLRMADDAYLEAFEIYKSFSVSSRSNGRAQVSATTRSRRRRSAPEPEEQPVVNQ